MLILWCLQNEPDSDYTGWNKLSTTPELNFLSQIVFLLFEDETQPLDSSARYYLHLHIGSGVKSREQKNSDGDPFIDGEAHSPSFVKRLPTLQPITPTFPIAIATPPPSSRVVRKIASFPSMHYLETSSATSLTGTPPPRHRYSSYSFSGGVGVPRDDSLLLKLSPEQRKKRLRVGYTNASLQTLGEPG